MAELLFPSKSTGALRAETGDETATRILSAAESRFRDYGYGKTTMVDIAGDCGMSAANIYRFFQHKQAIAVALIEQYLRVLESKMNAIAADDDITVAEKMHRMVILQLRSLHDSWRELPKFHELLDDVCRSDSTVIDAHRAAKLDLFNRLIREANSTGEFAVNDVDKTAEAFVTATLIFSLPGCMSFFALEEFERRASIVVDLLIKAMKPHQMK